LEPRDFTALERATSGRDLSSFPEAVQVVNWENRSAAELAKAIQYSLCRSDILRWLNNWRRWVSAHMAMTLRKQEFAVFRRLERRAQVKEGNRT
jgi:hypothetical protein